MPNCRAARGQLALRRVQIALAVCADLPFRADHRRADGHADAHRLTVLAVAAVARRRCCRSSPPRSSAEQTVLYDNSFYINQKIYANKLLDMDFPSWTIPNARRSPRSSRTKNGWLRSGARARCGDEAADVRFGVLGVVALTVTLFTQRVPESAGAWTVLNHPLFLLGCLLLLALLSVLPSLCMNRASMLTAELAPLARLATGFFNFLRSWRSATATARATSACITSRTSARAMLRPIRRSVRTTTVRKARVGPRRRTDDRERFGLGAVHRGSVPFVCLKALAGAFGAGSVVQYVSALTALSGHLSQLVVYGGDVRSNAPFLQELFAFLDTPNEMYQGSLTTEKRSDRKYEIEFRDVSFATPARRIGRCAICR